MLPRPTESSLAQVLRTMLGMISGPTALDVFRLDKSFSTPLDSIIMFLMDGIFLFDKSGRMLSFTLVNTDWNCSTKFSSLLFCFFRSKQNCSYDHSKKNLDS